MSSGGGKDVVETYMDALFESSPLDAPPSDIAQKTKPVIPASTISPVQGAQKNIQRRVVASVPFKQAIVDLEDACKLESSRREELQAILTRQALAPKKVTEEKAVVKPVPTPTRRAFRPPLKNLPKTKSVDSVSSKLTEGMLPNRQPSVTVEPPEQWLENGRPLWAQNQFSALLFKVSGLTLAVPLTSLGQIHHITDKLTPIFGQADWLMGLQDTPNGRVRTINTSLYIMPERYNPEFINTAKYVISIVGLGWGLAVDEVHQPTKLNPDDITWRTERSKRPWLAGTVKSAMCALLDIPQLGFELEKATALKQTK